MAKIRIKKRWKKLLCGVLVMATLIGACVGVSAFLKKDSKKIDGTSFTVGAVDTITGAYTKTKASIVSKDVFECEGLTIEPDFKATGSFQVFYYAPDKSFIGASALMNAADGAYHIPSDMSFAKYCRVMIVPEVPEDAEAKDFEIGFFKVYDYANDYKITVAKKSTNTISENLYSYVGRGEFVDGAFTLGSSYYCGNADITEHSGIIVKICKADVAEGSVGVLVNSEGERTTDIFSADHIVVSNNVYDYYYFDTADVVEIFVSTVGNSNLPAVWGIK